jgi:branched-chain amino acid transport system permease protein
MIIGLTVARPIVVGIVQGCGFGLVAIGIVLIYKSARIFNFAAGEFATLGAFGAYLASGPFGSLPWFIGGSLMALCGVGAGVVVGMLTERLVVRPLADRPKVTVLVATAAVAISLIALQFLSPKVQGRLFRSKPVWRGDMTWFGREQLFGVIVSHQQVLIVVTLALAGGLLALFFKTDIGLATLASSQEPTATRLMGVRLSRVSMLVWAMAGGLAGLAGVLLTAVNGSFNPAFGTTDLLIPAFTAAVLGGMTSVPGAFAGGILLGIVENLAQFNVTSKTLPGAPDVAVLTVLIAVLLVRPAGLMGKEA